tara:strand:+ start:13964 stop:14407 length:444 start_codon:yes stop_codon:yes gene_type:complete
MVTFDWDTYTPYMLGFENDIKRLNRLEALAGAGSNYPPYNIISGSDNRTILEVALAGFSRKDIEVATEENVLTLSAYPEVKEEREYAHKGIATRSFTKSWQLGDDVEVKSVDYVDGLLTVVLEKFVPEEKKRKLWFSERESLPEADK